MENKRENAKKRLGCEISDYNYENDVYLLEQKNTEYKTYEEKLNKLRLERDNLKSQISSEKNGNNDRIKISLLRGELRAVEENYRFTNKEYKNAKRDYKSLFQKRQ